MLFPGRRDFAKKKKSAGVHFYKWDFTKFCRYFFSQIIHELSSKRNISRFFGESSHQRKTYLVFLFTYNICNSPSDYSVSNLSKCNRQKISTKCNFEKDWPQKRHDLNVNLVYPLLFKEMTTLHFPIIRSTHQTNPLPSAPYIPFRFPAYFQDSQFSLFGMPSFRCALFLSVYAVHTSLIIPANFCRAE